MATAFDIHSNMIISLALPELSLGGATTFSGSIINTDTLEGLEFVISMGTITSGVATFLLEDGDDPGLSDAATVTGDDLLGNNPRFVVGDTDTVARVGYVGNKRFVRLNITVTGATVNVNISAIAVQTMSKSQPTVEQDGTQI